MGNDVPVLIVGAGAGGLTTSALLAKHGVRSLVVEKRREIFLFPKARNLSFRSLEIMRGLGLAEQIHAIAEGVSDMVVKPALNSAEEKQALDAHAIFSPFQALSPEPAGQYCPQSALEPILLAYIRRHGSRARYGTELCSLEQDDSGVKAVLRERDTGSLETLRADYLVAADGAHSPIRDTLGVTSCGYGALPIYVVFIYFRGAWRRFVPNLGDGGAVQVENAGVQGIFLPVRDDFGMFITTYFPRNGETAAQFTVPHCRELLTKAIGEPVDVDVVDVAPWQPYERVADQFAAGRVFFVGDSAHTMPPFKAGGANTAIQSAHNLAWKLAAVLNGTADPALLTTYHTERHPVGRFNARQSLTGPALNFLRLDGNEPRLPPDEEAPMFALLAGYQYHSAAVVSDEPAQHDADDVLLVDELHGQPGTRLPHAWILRDGRRISTLDLLGTGFALFTGDERWRAAVRSAEAALGLPITMQCIPRHEWAAMTALEPDGALLVRPDDFVGWRTAALPADPEAALHKAVSTILCRQ